ncbi:MAG TPA: hypothetical protein VIR59_04330 [Gaiellaceae bacterium]
MSQWNWLIGGLGVAFAMPFVFADVLALPRDLYYGLYMASVLALVTAWVRASQFDVRAALARRWALAVTLGVGCGALLSVMVLRTEDATPHPQGIDLAAAVAWRGVLYGITDGVLLSVFPILAVFAAFAGRPVLHRLRGKLAVGALALGMSLAFTAVYHLGYPEFRGDMLRKPLAGDVVWSVPTLVTLNPLGAPIAHAGLHVSAVLHSYDTGTYLPPHGSP